jgi:hypothetical protein
MKQTRRDFFRGVIAGTAALAGCVRAQRSDIATSRERRILDVTHIGAVGDGQTFADAAIVRGVKELTAREGGVLFFPPGTYRVSDRHAVELENCSRVTFYGPGATLLSDTYAGTDGAVLLFTGVCRQVAFRGLQFETRTASPNAYDNTISFYSREPDAFQQIQFVGCHFVRSSNKHVNIDGAARDVVIDMCTFGRGNQNSHPGPEASRLAAVFFRFDGKAPQPVQTVRVTNCTFADEGLFCISLDQFDGAPQGKYFFSDIAIRNNSFLRSTGGLWIRGEGITIEGNYFEDVGLSHALQAYEQAPVEGRFFSRFRARSNQVATLDNSLRIQRGAVVECFDGSRIRVQDNVFVHCGETQLTGPNQKNLEGLYISASRARSAMIRGNSAYERRPLPAIPPPFNCGTISGEYHVECKDNRLRIGSQPPHRPVRPTVDWTRERS